jgi:hydrogenase nickel incorporation protein HypA/HybF
MHELSIALSIVDIATEAARKNGGGTVEALYLRLGKLSGVAKDALLFSWELASADTPIKGSRLIIEEVPVVVHCTLCDADRTIDSTDNFECPVCNEPTPTVVSGKELQLSALEIV